MIEFKQSWQLPAEPMPIVIFGAGSIVTKDTEPWMIYVGSPAKAVKLRDKGLIIRGGKELNNLN